MATFADVYSAYRKLQGQQILPQDMSLRQFGQVASDLTGDQTYSSTVDDGAFGSLVKKGSYWLDQGLEATGLPDVTARAGKNVAEWLGVDGELGESLGRSLPRQLVNFLPFLFGGPATILGRLGVAALAGGLQAADTYEKTDSKLLAAVNAAMPLAATKGATAATSLATRYGLLRPEVVRRAVGDQIVDQSVIRGGDIISSYLIQQVGATAAQEALNYAGEALHQGKLNPYEGMSFRDWAFQAVAGNIPFAAFDLPQLRQKEVVVGQRVVPEEEIKARGLPAAGTSEGGRLWREQQAREEEAWRKAREAEMLDKILEDPKAHPIEARREARKVVRSVLSEFVDKYGEESLAALSPEKRKEVWNNFTQNREELRGKDMRAARDYLDVLGTSFGSEDLMKDKNFNTILRLAKKEKYRKEFKKDPEIKKAVNEFKKSLESRPLAVDMQAGDVVSRAMASMRKKLPQAELMAMPVEQRLETWRKILGQEAGDVDLSSAKERVEQIEKYLMDEQHVKEVAQKVRARQPVDPNQAEFVFNEDVAQLADKNITAKKVTELKEKDATEVKNEVQAAKVVEDAKELAKVDEEISGEVLNVAENEVKESMEATKEYLDALPGSDPKATTVTAATGERNRQVKKIKRERLPTLKRQAMLNEFYEQAKADPKLKEAMRLVDDQLAKTPAGQYEQLSAFRNWFRKLDGETPTKEDLAKLKRAMKTTEARELKDEVTERAYGPKIKKDDLEAAEERLKDFPGYLYMQDYRGGQRPVFASKEAAEIWYDAELAAGRVRKRPTKKAEKSEPAKKAAKKKAEKVAEVLTKDADEPEDIMAKSILQTRFADVMRKLFVDGLVTKDEGMDLLDRMKLAKTKTEQVKLVEELEALHKDYLKDNPAEDDSDVSTWLLGSTEETFDDYLTRVGITEKERLLLTPRLKELFDRFNLPDVNVGLLINDLNSKRAHGAAAPQDNWVWLAASEMNERASEVVLAHEMGHMAMEQLAQGRAGPELQEKYEAMRKEWNENPEEARKIVVEMINQLPKNIRDLVQTQDQLRGEASMTFEEHFASAMGAWALSKPSRVDSGFFASVMPPAFRNFMKSMMMHLRKLVGAFKTAIKLSPDPVQEKLTKDVENLTKYFDEVVEGFQDVENSLTEFERLVTGGTKDMWAMRMSELYGKPTESLFLQADESGVPKFQRKGVFTTFYDNAVRRLWDLGLQNPAFQPLVNVIYNNQPLFNTIRNQAIAVFHGGIDETTGRIKMTGEKHKRHMSLTREKNPWLNALISDAAMAWQQAKMSDVATVDAIIAQNFKWPPAGNKQRNLSKELLKLTPEQKYAVNEWFQDVASMNKTVYDQIIKGYVSRYQSLMKRQILSALGNGNWHDADGLAKITWDTFETIENPDELLGSKTARLMQLLKNEKLMFQLYDTYVVGKDFVEQLTKFHQENPGIMSMMRKGKYLVRAYDKNGKEFIDTLNSHREYDKWVANAKKAGFVQFSQPVLTESQSKFGVGDELLELVQELELRNAERIEANNRIPPEIKEELKNELGLAGQIARRVASQHLDQPSRIQGLPSGKRRAVAGSLDMVATQKLWAETMARITSRRMAKAEIDYLLTNPELLRFQEDVRMFKEHVEHYFEPDSEASKALTKIQTVYHLGANLPGMLVETLQPIMTALPELFNRGLGNAQAAKLMWGAFKDMAKFSSKLLARKVGIGDERRAFDAIANPDERDMLKTLINEGVMSFGATIEADDIYRANTAIDLQRIAGGYSNPNAVDRTWTKIQNLADMSMKVYSSAQRHNEGIAALMGYRLAKAEMGSRFTHKAGIEAAKEFMRTTMYSGGAANRPLLRERYQTIGALAYGLQGYTLGWANQLFRYVNHWRGAEYLNLSAEQRKRARKAALSLLGVQFASAGAMGMPFFGAALKILEQLTGEDFTNELYSKISTMLEEDATEGGGLTNLILHGGANTAARALGVPIDISSRMSMDGMFGLSNYNGMDQGFVWGPIGGMLESLFLGIKSATQGEYLTAASHLAPTALKKAIRFARDGGFTDDLTSNVRLNNGNMVELGTAESLGYILGFQPQKVTALQKFSQMKLSAENSLRLETRRDIAEVINMLRMNPTMANMKLDEMVRKSGGTKTRAELARQVAEVAIQAKYPYDIRSDIGARQGEYLLGIAKALGVSLPEAREIEKRAAEDSIMAMLGVRSRPNMSTLARLRANDQRGNRFIPFVHSNG